MLRFPPNGKFDKIAKLHLVNIRGLDMGEQAKVKETVRLYSKVWQLPTYRGIIIRTTAMALISSGLFAIFRAIEYNLSLGLEAFIFYCTLLFSAAFLGSCLLYLVVRKEGSPLDGRRALGAAQFGIIFWYFLGTLGGLIDLIASTALEANMWIFGMGLGYLAFSFLVTGLSDHHPIRNFAAALMPALTWIAIVFVLSIFTTTLPILPEFWLLGIALIFIAGSLSVHYIFRSVSQPFERDLGINGPQLLRAFGYDYLVENPEPLETLLTQISVKQDVPMELIVFQSDEKLVSVGVILYVHPGPFRDIGSSGLPSRVVKHINEKYGVQAFVLHGTCTHHQNLTNKHDYQTVLDEIDRLIVSTQIHPVASGLHWNDFGKFKVWTFFAGEDALAITTSAPEFTDDISLKVGEAAADAARKNSPRIRYVALADAHNCIDHDAVSLMPGDPEEYAYINAVRDAIAKNQDSPRSEISVGIHQIVPDYISSREGIGPGGIIAVVLRIGEKRSVIVSVDGNNVEPGYRERVQTALLGEGFDMAEVTTTDTHLVNAISLSSKGYPPVGQNKPDQILSTILEAARIAREGLQATNVGLAFGEAKGIRTFGTKGFDTLTQDVAEAASIAKRIGIISGIAAFFASLIISFLL